MKTHLNTSLLVLCSASIILTGCASAPDVWTSYDRAADFTQYKTFAFYSPLGTDRRGYQSIVSVELKADTQRELEARGLRLVTTDPQLLVNFNAALNNKLQVESTPASAAALRGGYYGYRASMYTTFPMYTDQTTVSQYKEGTLNIDVVDAARKQLVWEGVVKGSMSSDDLKDMPGSIKKAVTAAFAKYPIQAPAEK